MKDLLMHGESVLVTGSSRGIGYGIAMGMHEAGAEVVFHGNRNVPENLPENCDFLAVDLSLDDAAEKLIDQSFQLKPNLAHLVCNAGSHFDTEFLEMTMALYDKTMNLNVRSVFAICQAFARRMIELKREGSIVIVTSSNGFQAEPCAVAYDTSKGALVMMTRSLAVSLADHGIRVNSMAPGLIRTPLTSWIDTEERREDKEHYEKKILLGRIGEMSDCAGPTVFLCSRAARYITGQVLLVDGGITVAQVGKK